MITANEARKIIIEEEKKKVEAKITQAIENGYSTCYLGFYVSDATLEWLESLGYHVIRRLDPREGVYDTVVKWVTTSIIQN